MLNSNENRAEAQEWYNQHISLLIERVKTATAGTTKAIFCEVTRNLGEPWSNMVRRKPETRSPHCNVKLNMIWKAIGRARRKMESSGLMGDRMAFVEKRTRLAEENRRHRRRLAQRTEERLNKEGQDAVTVAIQTDGRRRKNQDGDKSGKGDLLTPQT